MQCKKHDTVPLSTGTKSALDLNGNVEITNIRSGTIARLTPDSSWRSGRYRFRK